MSRSVELEFNVAVSVEVEEGTIAVRMTWRPPPQDDPVLADLEQWFLATSA